MLRTIHLTLAEDISHVFIQPFDLVSSRKHKILHFLCGELIYLPVLILNPMRRQSCFGTWSHVVNRDWLSRRVVSVNYLRKV